MKTRLITLFLTLLGAIGVFAQDDPTLWTQPDRSLYPDRTFVFTVMSESPVAGDKIAAFINGECRGVYTFTGNPTVTQVDGKPSTLKYEVAPLEVFSTNEEAGLAITFKYSKQGAVYDVVPQEMTKPVVANHLTYGTLKKPVMFDMPVAITDVKLEFKDKTQQMLSLKIGESIDVLSQLNIVVVPETAQLPNNRKWSESTNYEMSGNVLTAKTATGGKPDKLSMTFDGTNIPSTNSIPVEILENEIPVTKIERVSPDNKFQTILAGQVLTVTFDIYPENATNKKVNITKDVDCLTIGEVQKTGNSFGKGEFSFTITGVTSGTSIVTVSTADGQFNFKMSITVEEKLESAQFKDASATYVVGRKYRVPQINTVPENYKILWNRAKLSIEKGEQFQPATLEGNTLWEYATDGYDEQGYYFIPRVICNDVKLHVQLDQLKEPVVQSMTFVREYTNQEGWSWVSMPYTYDFLNKNLDIFLVEVRSFNQQIYHDNIYGWFGDTFAMEPGQGYKQHLLTGTIYQIGYIAPTSPVDVVHLHKGWNWIGVPYEYDFGVDYLEQSSNLLPKVEGDILMSQNGFMTFTGGKWQGSNGTFGLLSGQGYLYKSTAEGSTVNWNKPFAVPQPELKVVAPTREKQSSFEEDGWSYDPKRFASAMAVIGTLPQSAQMNSEQYTIGAFVGDECRGEGRLLSNGLVLVCVNGKAGEEVSFKLRDKVTGHLYDFNTRVDFDLQAGTVQQPLPMSVKNEATGVNSIEGEALDIRYDGHSFHVDGGYPYQVFSVEGKRVSPNGLSAGIYLIRVDTPDGTICKRVLLK